MVNDAEPEQKLQNFILICTFTSTSGVTLNFDAGLKRK